MTLNFQALLDVLPKALLGWGGIFVITAVIVLSIVLLNLFTSKKSKEDQDK